MSCTVALMHADSVVGADVLAVLNESEHEWIGELKAFGNPSSAYVTFRDQELTVKTPTPEALRDVDIAILGGDNEVDAGAVSVRIATDQDDADVPLVVPRINPAEVDEHRGTVAIPTGPAIATALLLNGLKQNIQHVTGTILLPAGELGPQAIAELYSQTIALFNQDAVPTTVIGDRLAFNILPTSVSFDGFHKLIQCTTDMTALMVPVFGGTTLILDVYSETKLNAEEASLGLADSPGVDLGEYTKPFDIVGSSKVSCVQPSSHHGLRLVATADEIRLSAHALIEAAREINERDAF